jgi:hypothetical protein
MDIVSLCTLTSYQRSLNISIPNQSTRKKQKKRRKKVLIRRPECSGGLRNRETPEKIFSDNVQVESGKMRQRLAQQKGKTQYNVGQYQQSSWWSCTRMEGSCLSAFLAEESEGPKYLSRERTRATSNDCPQRCNEKGKIVVKSEDKFFSKGACSWMV